MMINLKQLRYTFSKDIGSYDQHKQQLDGTMRDIIRERRRMRAEGLVQQKINLPIENSTKFVYDNIVNITLFMRHDCWKSNYVYALLNYNKLGFQRISDMQFLDRASYFNKLRDMSEADRWPCVKVTIALNPKIVLTGIPAITQFFRENYYFNLTPQPNTPQITALTTHINTQLLPHLQSLFWHPLLTFQYTFHTNISSYAQSSPNYHIVNILRRNLFVVLSRICRHAVEIMKDRKRYFGSKDRFTKAIKQLESQYLSKGQFFGGNVPNYVDFYLFSLLRAKSGSHLFLKYLENSIKGETWRWWIRMGQVCQYSSERVTML